MPLNPGRMLASNNIAAFSGISLLTRLKHW